MAMRLTSATGRPLAALALLAALCACATTALEPSVGTPAAGWRIVERTGQARYSPPESGIWLAATTGQTLAAGSEVATGRGGRLIVDAPARNLSVGPDSHFVLPDGDWDDRLEQRAGWLRYRIAAAGTQPFRIRTRSLELELSSGVVDVDVDDLATEVMVKEGQVRVATPDGLRQSQMIAGQSARAGDPRTELAVRLAPDQPLQPVEPVVVPAMQPKRAPAGAPAGAPTARAAPVPPEPALTPATPSRSEPLVLPSAMAPQNAKRPAVADDSLAAGAASDKAQGLTAGRVEGTAGRPGAPGRVTEAIAPAPRPSGPAAIRGTKFERLSAGVIDGIRPAQPAGSEQRPTR
jgi:hypothetical protein